MPNRMLLGEPASTSTTVGGVRPDSQPLSGPEEHRRLVALQTDVRGNLYVDLGAVEELLSDISLELQRIRVGIGILANEDLENAV
jgi:hypothetical protein